MNFQFFNLCVVAVLIQRASSTFFSGGLLDSLNPVKQAKTVAAAAASALSLTRPPPPVVQSVLPEDDLEDLVQEAGESRGQGFSEQNLQGQGLNGQNLQGQGLNGQNLQGQGLIGQISQPRGLNGQNLQGQGLNGQNLQVQGLNGQNSQAQGLNGQNLQVKGLNGLNSQAQGLNGQKLQGQGLNGQNVQMQGLNGQNSQSQGLNGQNLQGQGLNGQNLQGQGLNGPNSQSRGLNGQNMQAQGLNGQNLQAQSLNGQNLQGQGLNGQNVQMQGLTGQNLQLQGLNGQNSQAQGLNGQNLHGHDMQRNENMEVADFKAFNMAFLDDAQSRAAVEKAVHAIVNSFKDERLRRETTELLARCQMFQGSNVATFVETVMNNVNRVVQEPTNLYALSQLLDIGIELLFDERYHDILSREMILIDNFLEDTVAKLITQKFGKLVTVFTENRQIYESAGTVLDQVNVLMDKSKLKEMQDFAVSISRTLVG